MLFFSKQLNSWLLPSMIVFLSSCYGQYSSVSERESIVNNKNIEIINLNNLMLRLLKSDEKLTPKVVFNKDGSSTYTYIKSPGEGEIDLKEIKKRILVGSEFYRNDRKKIVSLLTRVNELKINNKLDNLNNGVLGLWVPSKNLLVVDYKVVDMGSPAFLDVLRHEVIHVAQSCYGGSRKTFPKRIGLPLEFSKEINFNLTHKAYSQNPEEVNNIEREAFSYSKVDGAATKLLNRFCE